MKVTVLDLLELLRQQDPPASEQPHLGLLVLAHLLQHLQGAQS